MSTPVISRPATTADVHAISTLHQLAFGPGRFARTAYRVREGAPAVSRFCRVAMRDRELIAAVRLTEIGIGGRPGALLLGPLAVSPAWTGQGYGRQLVGEVVEAAAGTGVSLIVLVGDVPYYGRFGFAPVVPGQIVFPGPVDPARILAKQVVSDALITFRGLVTAAPVAISGPPSSAS